MKLGMPGFVPRIHVFASLEQDRRGWPASESDAVLRTAMPGHGERKRRLPNFLIFRILLDGQVETGVLRFHPAP
jgi:hypothetical protein